MAHNLLEQSTYIAPFYHFMCCYFNWTWPV